MEGGRVGEGDFFFSWWRPNVFTSLGKSDSFDSSLQLYLLLKLKPEVEDSMFMTMHIKELFCMEPNVSKCLQPCLTGGENNILLQILIARLLIVSKMVLPRTNCTRRILMFEKYFVLNLYRMHSSKYHSLHTNFIW